MGDAVVQLPVFLLLAVGIGLCVVRWVRPRREALDGRGTGLLLLLILASMAGFLGAPFWWFDVRQSFSWDLPPLASRMLAAAAAALTVGSVLCLERPTRVRVRLYLLMLVTYIVPLTVAIVVAHLDRFDPAAFITYGFFAAVVAVSVPALYFLWDQPAIPSAEDAPRHPSALERASLVTTAGVTGAWGIALFVTDKGPSSVIWVWPGDLLSSRLIGVMLLSLAVGSFYSLLAPAAAPVMLAVTATYGVSVPLASAWNAFADKPVKPAYVWVFAVIAAGSLLALVLGRQPRRRWTRPSESGA
jgi:hypothetical protein